MPGSMLLLWCIVPSILDLRRFAFGWSKNINIFRTSGFCWPLVAFITRTYHTQICYRDEGGPCHCLYIFFYPVFISILSSSATSCAWFFKPHLGISIRSQPITVLLRSITFLYAHRAVSVVMTHLATYEAEGWEPFIFKGYPELLPILAIFLPRRKGLSSCKSTLILMNLAWSDRLDLLSDSMNFPRLFPNSLPTSLYMCSNKSPQIWTQKGEWVKVMFLEERPSLHLVSSKRLLSKFQGTFFSTHFRWYSKLNLNYSTLLPTSTICKSDPIFHADLKVFFIALWFWCLSKRSRPKRLRKHSSSSSDLHLIVMGISSSSSFVSWRLSKRSTTTCSMATPLGKEGHALVENPNQSRGRERLNFLGWERKSSYEGEFVSIYLDPKEVAN